MSEETKNDSILPILPICGYDQDYEVNHISGIHDGTVKAPLQVKKKKSLIKAIGELIEKKSPNLKEK